MYNDKFKKENKHLQLSSISSFNYQQVIGKKLLITKQFFEFVNDSNSNTRLECQMKTFLDTINLIEGEVFDFEQDFRIILKRFENKAYVEESKSVFVKKLFEKLNAEKIKISEIKSIFNSHKYEHEKMISESNDPVDREFMAHLIISFRKIFLNNKKIQLEAKLNKSKILEEKIRNKRKEIRCLFSFNEDSLKEDEERMKRLWKGQKEKTKKEYDIGIEKTKEEIEEENLIKKIVWKFYNSDQEIQDIVEVQNIINNEFAKISQKNLIQIENRNNLETILEKSIPYEEQEQRLLVYVRERFEKYLFQLKNEIVEIEKENKRLEKEKQKQQYNNEIRKKEIIQLYKSFNLKLEEFSKKEKEIEEKKNEKISSLKNKEDTFTTQIFEEVGGQKKDNYASDSDEIVNNKSCNKTRVGENGCYYKLAVKDGVNYTLEQKRNNKNLSPDELLEYLKNGSVSVSGGYQHSVPSHGNDLKNIVNQVSIRYDNLQAELKEMVKQFDNQIASLIRKKEKIENERTSIFDEIKEKERIYCSFVLDSKAKEEEETNHLLKLNEISDFYQTIEDKKAKWLDLIEDNMKKLEILNDNVDDLDDKDLNLFEDKTDLEEQIIEEHEKNLAHFKSRLFISDIESFAISLQSDEKLEQEIKTIKGKIKNLEKNLENIDTEKHQVNRERMDCLNNIKLVDEHISENTNKYEGMICRRPELQNRSHFGLENDIENFQFKIDKINNNIKTMALNRAKSKWSYVRCEVFKEICEESGVIMLPDEPIEDIDDENMFKNRPHSECQYDKKKCNYYGCINEVIKIVKSKLTGEAFVAQRLLRLEIDRESNLILILEDKKKLNDLINFKDKYEHIMENHEGNLINDLIEVNELIVKYDDETDRLIENLNRDKNNLEKELMELIPQITERKKLDKSIVLKRKTYREESNKLINKGIDVLITDNENEYFFRDGRNGNILVSNDLIDFSIKYFKIKDKEKQLRVSESIKKMLENISSSSKSIDLNVFKKDNQFFNILVEFFAKEYLKIELTIEENSNIRIDIKKEVLRIDENLNKLDRKTEWLNERKKIQKELLEKIKKSAVDKINFTFPILQFYEELLTYWDKKDKEDDEMIIKEKDLIKELKNKKLEINANELENKIFRNKLKIVLLKNSYKHAFCKEKSCCYGANLIQDVIEFIVFTVSKEPKTLRKSKLEALNFDILKNKLSKKYSHTFEKHLNDLKCVIWSILRYLKELNCTFVRDIKKREQKHKLKMKILMDEKDIRNSLLKPEIRKRIEIINNYVNFVKGCIFKHKKNDEITSVEKELNEHNENFFKDSFKTQILSLLKILITLHNKESSDLNSASSFLCLKKTFFYVFNEYYSELKNDNLVFTSLSSKLQKEIDSADESRIKKLFRKKRNHGGGLDFFLKKLSWSFQFQENGKLYSKNIDPLLIYEKILENEKKNRKKNEKEVLEKLNKELSDLENERRKDCLSDHTLSLYELECVNEILTYYERMDEIEDLKMKAHSISSISKSKDDFYVFEMQDNRMSIQLFQTDLNEKYGEIKRIDRIREYSNEFEKTILRKKAEKERQEIEWEKESDQIMHDHLIKFQHYLFKRGYFICGFDRFFNGEKLDKIDSFISLVISSLLEVYKVYELGAINETDEVIEGFTKKIRFILDSKKVENVEEEEHLKEIISIVNNFFITDNLQIGCLSVFDSKNNRNKKISSGDGKSMELALYRDNYFLFVLIDSLKFSCTNIVLDLNLKINYIHRTILDQDDLLKDLCMRRFRILHKIDIHESKTLGKDYKMEIDSLSKIKSLKDFSSLIGSVLSIHDVLFSYLTYLVSLEESIKNDEENSKRLNTIKNAYKKSVFNIIKNEQNRRQKENQLSNSETKEESYLKNLINEMEDEQEKLREEISNKEDQIQKDLNLIEELLFEKEAAKEKCNEKLGQLKEKYNEAKHGLSESQLKLKELMKNEKENKVAIMHEEENIKKLTNSLKRIEDEIKEKESELNKLKNDVAGLSSRFNELDTELKRIGQERERKMIEKANKEKEKHASEAIIQFIKNLNELLSQEKFLSSRKLVEKLVKDSMSLRDTVNGFKKHDEVFNFLIKQMSEDQVNAFNIFIQDSDKKIAGESHSDILKRLQRIIRDAINFECEIDNRILSDKRIINRFKIKGTNISYSDVHEKVKSMISKQLPGGLTFNEEGVLKCSSCGLTGIDDLPDSLKMLVQNKIELKYKNLNYGDDPRKNASYSEASKIINELKIDYKLVVRAFIDEIEIVVGNKFILNKSPSYPGIDLNIYASQMAVLDGAYIDTSGVSGQEFEFKKAASGFEMRKINVPCGLHGVDGYNGEHGMHGGNIVIKVDQEIENLEKLVFLKADGGNGGEGQLGGDGDKGKKGINGDSGVAPDTKGMGSGQTCIGFGKPGTPGGIGGKPGQTGRPGKGGIAGFINIMHGNSKISENNFTNLSRINGKDADDVLLKADDSNKPKGGLGGDPGLYGLDEIKDKKNFFKKTNTSHDVVDREDLALNYSKFRNEVLSGNPAESTNLDVLFAAGISVVTLDAALVLCPHLTLNEKCRLKFKNPSDTYEYRDRDKNSKINRGKQNNEESTLRNEECTPAQKNEERNMESLFSTLKEKQNEIAEISGADLHNENLNEIKLQEEDLVNDLEALKEEEESINDERSRIKMQQDAAVAEIENVIMQIDSLKNNVIKGEADRATSVRNLISQIEKSQKLRDSQSSEQLKAQQILDSLAMMNNLSEEFNLSKQDLAHIIDEYLELIRARLKRNQNELNFLKRQLANGKNSIIDLKSKLRELQNERFTKTMIEEQIEEVLEEEIEQEHELQAEIEVNSELTKINGRGELIRPLKKPEKRSEYVMKTKEYYSSINLTELTDTDEIKKFFSQAVQDLRSGCITLDEIDILEKKMLTRSDLIKIYEDFKREIDIFEVVKYLNLEMKSLEKNILLDNLNKILETIYKDDFAVINNSNCKFDYILSVIKNMDHLRIPKRLHEKLLKRREKYFVENDKLKDDLESFVDAFSNLKTFYLEALFLDHQKSGISLLDYEKALNEQNESPCLENLRLILEEFLKLNYEAESPVSKEFFKVFVENLKKEAALFLEFLLNKKCQKNKDDENIETYFEKFKSTRSLLQSIFPENTNVCNILMEIVFKFEVIINELGNKNEIQKIQNKSSKEIINFGKQLIYYVDDEKFNQLIDQLLNIDPKDCVNIFKLSDFLNDIEDSVIGKNKEEIKKLEDEKVLQIISNQLLMLKQRYEKVEIEEKEANLNLFLLRKLQIWGENQFSVKLSEHLGEVESKSNKILEHSLKNDKNKATICDNDFQQMLQSMEYKILTDSYLPINKFLKSLPEKYENVKEFNRDELSKHLFECLMVNEADKIEEYLLDLLGFDDESRLKQSYLNICKNLPKDMVRKICKSTNTKDEIIDYEALFDLDEFKKEYLNEEYKAVISILKVTSMEINDISSMLNKCADDKSEKKILTKVYNCFCVEIEESIKNKICTDTELLSCENFDRVKFSVERFIYQLEEFYSFDYERHILLDDIFNLFLRKLPSNNLASTLIDKAMSFFNEKRDKFLKDRNFLKPKKTSIEQLLDFEVVHFIIMNENDQVLNEFQSHIFNQFYLINVKPLDSVPLLYNCFSDLEKSKSSYTTSQKIKNFEFFKVFLIRLTDSIRFKNICDLLDKKLFTYEQSSSELDEVKTFIINQFRSSLTMPDKIRKRKLLFDYFNIFTEIG